MILDQQLENITTSENNKRAISHSIGLIIDHYSEHPYREVIRQEISQILDAITVFDTDDFVLDICYMSCWFKRSHINGITWNPLDEVYSDFVKRVKGEIECNEIDQCYPTQDVLLRRFYTYFHGHETL